MKRATPKIALYALAVRYSDWSRSAGREPLNLRAELRERLAYIAEERRRPVNDPKLGDDICGRQHFAVLYLVFHANRSGLQNAQDCARGGCSLPPLAA